MPPPKTIPFNSAQAAPQTVPFSTVPNPSGFAGIDSRDFIDKAHDFLLKNNVPGAQLGDAVGHSLFSLYSAFQAARKGDFDAAKQALAPKPTDPNFGKVVGDTARAAILPASLAISGPASIPAAIGQFGALGAASSAADAAAAGKGPGAIVQDAAA